MQAYTYTIKHLPTNKIYYGVRKSTTVDIGIGYFSSSKLVKRLIEEEPIENFEFKLRRKFSSYEEARLHETNLLSRLNAVSNPMFFNQAISAPRVCCKDSESEKKRRISISKTMKKVWQDPKYKDSHFFVNIPKEERSRRGKVGATIRAENYASGKTKHKPRKPPSYKEVIIEKNNIKKTVKSNQVPAYVKYGWKRA